MSLSNIQQILITTTKITVLRIQKQIYLNIYLLTQRGREIKWREHTNQHKNKQTSKLENSYIKNNYCTTYFTSTYSLRDPFRNTHTYNYTNQQKKKLQMNVPLHWTQKHERLFISARNTNQYGLYVVPIHFTQC